MRRTLTSLLFAGALAGCLVAPPQQQYAPPPQQPQYQPPPQQPQYQPPPPQYTPPPPAPGPAPAPAWRPGEGENQRWLRGLRLSVTLARPAVWTGEPVWAHVTMQNDNREPVVVHALSPGEIAVSLVDGTGRIQACRPPQRAFEGANLFTLEAGQRLDTDLNVLERCGGVGLGSYTVRTAVELNGPWGEGGVYAVRGRIESNGAGFRIDAPPQAAVGLTLRALQPASRTDAPAQVEAVLQNYGNAAARLTAVRDGSFGLLVRDAFGRNMNCSPPRFGAPGMLQNLDPGRGQAYPIDVAARCTLSEPGTYTIVATLDGWDATPGGGGGRHLESNPVTVTRQRPTPVANLVLTAASRGPVAPNGQAWADVRLVNNGPDAVDMFNLSPETLRISMSQDGRPVPCNDDRRREAWAGGFVHLRPGSQLTTSVDLGKRCRFFQPGNYLVQVSMFLESSHDGRSFGYLGWTGRLDAQPFWLQVQANPPPPSFPAPLPPPTPLSPGQGPNAPPVPQVATGHLAVMVSPQVNGMLGRDAMLDVTVRSDGREGAWVYDPDPGFVTLVVKDDQNRFVSCNAFQPPPVSRDRFRQLWPGNERVVRIDLLRACSFRGAGQYRVDVRYFIPGHFVGREFGLAAWTGELGRMQTTLALAMGGRPWENPGPLSPGQGPSAPPGPRPNPTGSDSPPAHYNPPPPGPRPSDPPRPVEPGPAQPPPVRVGPGPQPTPTPAPGPRPIDPGIGTGQQPPNRVGPGSQPPGTQPPPNPQPGPAMPPHPAPAPQPRPSPPGGRPEEPAAKPPAPPPAPPAAPPAAAPSNVDPETRACIDRELQNRHLNGYGDAPGTQYAGGSPLFNPANPHQERMDRYLFVLERHLEIRTACQRRPSGDRPMPPRGR